MSEEQKEVTTEEKIRAVARHDIKTMTLEKFEDLYLSHVWCDGDHPSIIAPYYKKALIDYSMTKCLDDVFEVTDDDILTYGEYIEQSATNGHWPQVDDLLKEIKGRDLLKLLGRLWSRSPSLYRLIGQTTRELEKRIKA